MIAPLVRYHRRLVAAGPRSPADRLVVQLLRPLGWLYGALARARNHLYDHRLLPVVDLGRPTIAVGNLTAGGTGKTPLTLWLARELRDRGCRVAVLSRGYGRRGGGKARLVSDGRQIFLDADEAGDEPRLLAEQASGVVVAVGGDRAAAARLALAAARLALAAAPDLFLLDDAFQHRRARRDLDLVLVDGTRPFGNGRVLPAGLLREPPSGLARADLVVLTRAPRSGAIPDLPAARTVCRVHFRLGPPVEVGPSGPGTAIPWSVLAERRGLAFAAIADPDRFFRSLQEVGLDLAGELPLADHARYGRREIDRLLTRKAACGADFLITTEKDAVKLGSCRHRLQPLFVAPLELDLLDREVLEARLEEFLARWQLDRKAVKLEE